MKKIIIILVIFFFDRATKMYLIDLQTTGTNIDFYIFPFLNFYLVWNTGIGFGLASLETNIFYHILTAIITIVNLALIFFLLKAKGIYTYLFALIIGGSLGNLFDRIYYYAVPDFIDIHVGNFHWFIFNVADIFITVGIIGFIFTDANIPSVFLKAILKKVIATSFNSITVDSDTSTNDMVGIFATGRAKNLRIYNVLDPKLQDFEKALHRLCLNLAKQIIVDGEGAKKFITINVIGARSTVMAKNVAFSIANSPLVKTAIAGEDPNWGRIIMACGKSGENIIANKIQLKIGNYLVVEQGAAAKNYKESDVKKYMKWNSINIEVNLNIGNAFYTAYTCDFTHDYIDINTDYRN